MCILFSLNCPINFKGLLYSSLTLGWLGHQALLEVACKYRHKFLNTPHTVQAFLTGPPKLSNVVWMYRSPFHSFHFNTTASLWLCFPVWWSVKTTLYNIQVQWLIARDMFNHSWYYLSYWRIVQFPIMICTFMFVHRKLCCIFLMLYGLVLLIFRWNVLYMKKIWHWLTSWGSY